jgi:hypothetical protein
MSALLLLENPLSRAIPARSSVEYLAGRFAGDKDLQGFLRACALLPRVSGQKTSPFLVHAASLLAARLAHADLAERTWQLRLDPVMAERHRGFVVGVTLALIGAGKKDRALAVAEEAAKERPQCAHAQLASELAKLALGQGGSVEAVMASKVFDTEGPFSSKEVILAALPSLAKSDQKK